MGPGQSCLVQASARVGDAGKSELQRPAGNFGVTGHEDRDHSGVDGQGCSSLGETLPQSGPGVGCEFSGHPAFPESK